MYMCGCTTITKSSREMTDLTLGGHGGVLALAANTGGVPLLQVSGATDVDYPARVKSRMLYNIQYTPCLLVFSVLRMSMDYYHCECFFFNV